MEMEANLLGAFGKQVGLPVACVCVVLVDRFKGDQIGPTPEQYHDWLRALRQLILRYLETYIVIRAAAPK
jgi:uridine phosphorylase